MNVFKSYLLPFLNLPTAVFRNNDIYLHHFKWRHLSISTLSACLLYLLDAFEISRNVIIYL
jgi:hypothetical protein